MAASSTSRRLRNESRRIEYASGELEAVELGLTGRSPQLADDGRDAVLGHDPVDLGLGAGYLAIVPKRDNNLRGISTSASNAAVAQSTLATIYSDAYNAADDDREDDDTTDAPPGSASSPARGTRGGCGDLRARTARRGCPPIRRRHRMMWRTVSPVMLRCPVRGQAHWTPRTIRNRVRWFPMVALVRCVPMLRVSMEPMTCRTCHCMATMDVR